MKAILAIYFVLVSGIPALCADHKYGFAAESDAALLARMRDPEIAAVILGCVHKFVPPADPSKSKTHTSYVTVIESYKGKIAIGDKVVVVVYAESGPKEEQELGTLRFYLLYNKDPADKDIPEGGFRCDWTDNLRYADYGEALRKLLRTRGKVPK